MLKTGLALADRNLTNISNYTTVTYRGTRSVPCRLPKTWFRVHVPPWGQVRCLHEFPSHDLDFSGSYNPPSLSSWGILELGPGLGLLLSLMPSVLLNEEHLCCNVESTPKWPGKCQWETRKGEGLGTHCFVHENNHCRYGWASLPFL